ncbi:MAG TPA: hypothetical protein VFA26_07955, partial [Gemmataceae bacterium]|nr:hypothetical protein [Gemmataceae bacterium]
DFPGESYWLWPLFEPKSNYLGYRNDGELERHFRDGMSRRDFTQVKQAAHLIHSHLQMTMPLVPLWQLDARVALRPAVRPVPFDPLAVFADIERWGKHTR